jgi:hypothetical protein
VDRVCGFEKDMTKSVKNNLLCHISFKYIVFKTDRANIVYLTLKQLTIRVGIVYKNVILHGYVCHVIFVIIRIVVYTKSFITECLIQENEHTGVYVYQENGGKIKLKSSTILQNFKYAIYEYYTEKKCRLIRWYSNRV